MTDVNVVGVRRDVGLQVPVHHAVVVKVGNRPAERCAASQAFFVFGSPNSVERGAVDVFHRQIRRAVLQDACLRPPRAGGEGPQVSIPRPGTLEGCRILRTAGVAAHTVARGRASSPSPRVSSTA
jgi:hypothetical protein